MKLSSW